MRVKQVFGAAIEFQSRAIALIDTLLERARQIPIGGLVPLPDTILVSALVFTPTYDPSTGAVDALIASGRRSDLDDPGHAVPSDARRRVDDGDAGAGEAVEQTRLADIRSADDGDAGK